jgi:hypothetical protein
MEPGSIADREMRTDYAPSPIGGQGQFSRADDQFKVYNSFNSQSFPRILASLSRPLEPLQHAYKVCNTLAKSREESRREGEEFLIMKLSSESPALAHP